MKCPHCSKEIKKRTNSQNSALHLFFDMISFALNELNQEFCYTGVTGRELSMMYTPNLVKTMFWHPIQTALFDTKSTTELNNEQINQISDIIIKFFAEKSVVLEFPSKETLNKNNNKL